MENTITRSILTLLVCALVLSISVGLGEARIDPAAVAGLWLFDEGSGTVAKDMSGNGNDGELMGNAAWTDGVSGSAVELDGIPDSFVSIADSPSLQMSDACSVTFWFRTGKVMVDMWADRQVVVGKHYTEYEVGIYTQGQLHTYTWGRPNADGYDEGILTSIAGKLPTGEADWVVDKWYHLAWTLDGNHEVAYVNGVKLDEFDKATMNTSPGDHPLEIGRRVGGSLPFLGAVDEVGVFRVALTQEDVQQIYEQGLGAATGVGTAVQPAGKLATAWGAIKSQ